MQLQGKGWNEVGHMVVPISLNEDTRLNALCGNDLHFVLSLAESMYIFAMKT